MDIKNFSDLSKLFTICRKKGIKSVKISSDSLEFTLDDEAPVSRYKAAKQDKRTPDPEMEGGYTDEQVLLWSSPAASDLGQ